MIERGWFGRALRLVLSDLPAFLVGGLILQVVTALSLGLLAGPAIGGIVWITLKHLRGEEVVFQDLFRGFERPGAMVLAGLAFGGLVTAGLFAFVVPGLVLGGLFCFAFPLMVDRELSPGEAFLASRKLAAGHDALDRSLFFLFVLLTGLSGVFLMLAGILFTWPLMWAIVAVAYEDLRSGAAAQTGLPVEPAGA